VIAMSQLDMIDGEFLRKRTVLKWGRSEKDAISLSVADIDFPAAREINNAVKKALEEDQTPLTALKGALADR
jgi:bifunctional pyridoxal-dependent enzyme with beta-cystathionase and maltose regulon repressor activities